MAGEVEARAAQVDPVSAHRCPLRAEPGEGLLLQSADRPAVGSDHPPPGHRGAVRGHHLADPAWSTPADQLGDVGVRAGPARRDGLHRPEHLLDVVHLLIVLGTLSP